jgi:hypothetical protein
LTWLTVAFASRGHAVTALGFLADAGFAFRCEEIVGGNGSDCATVAIAVRTEDRERLRTLVCGLHGIVIEEQLEATCVA